MTLFHIILIILFVIGLTMYIYCKIVHDTPSDFFDWFMLGILCILIDMIIFTILFMLYAIIYALINANWYEFFNYKVICF